MNVAEKDMNIQFASLQKLANDFGQWEVFLAVIVLLQHFARLATDVCGFKMELKKKNKVKGLGRQETKRKLGRKETFEF